MSAEDSWQQYVRAFSALVSARMAFSAQSSRRHEVVSRALLAGGLETSAALSYIAFLDASAVPEALPNLLRVALAVHGDTEQAWAVLGLLPRDVVIPELERETESVIQRGDYEEYACLMELWLRLGEKNRAAALAAQATASGSSDLVDIAEAFLEKHGLALGS